jgi:hypothetical protein
LCENNAGNFVIRNTKTHSRHKHWLKNSIEKSDDYITYIQELT